MCGCRTIDRHPRDEFSGDFMTTDLNKYIRNAAFLDKVVSAEAAASWIEGGMARGLGGFTLLGDSKGHPRPLSRRGQRERFRRALFSRASMGPTPAHSMAEGGIINNRIPYQRTPGQLNSTNA